MFRKLVLFILCSSKLGAMERSSFSHSFTTSFSSKCSFMLREKYPNSEFIWSVFSCLRTEYEMIRSIGKNEEYLSEFSLNAGEYGTEKLRIPALFTQFYILVLPLHIITSMLIFLYRKEKKIHKTFCFYKNQGFNTFKRYNQIIDLK